ncbi:hypothetical protein ACVIGB_000104 [Bradyrhizobium sp. USDA 4341]
MNRIEITTNGPIKGKLNLLRVADDYENSSVELDHETVERALQEGRLLKLLADSLDSAGQQILRDAVVTGAPVTLDDADVDLATLASALGIDPPAPRS